MKQFHERLDATAQAPLPQPAVDWRTALRLALLRTLAVGAALISLAAFGALGWLYVSTRQAPYLAAGGAVLLIGGTFVVALWAYTSNVRRHTWWQEELRAGLDLDGDGVLGRPEPRRLRLVAVRANGQVQEPVIMAEQDTEETPALLEGFELDPIDLAAFLAEAGRRGLTKNAWLPPGRPRYKLPSGQRVTRGVWDRVTAELVRLGWAENTPGGLRLTRRTVDLLRELEDL